MDKTIAYQGASGSFSNIAATRRFGKGNVFIGAKRFEEVFQIVERGDADYGVIPLENSITGTIRENFDSLAESRVSLVGEVLLKVDLHLVGIPLPGISFEERIRSIRKVMSHPRPLEQSRAFLDAHPWLEPTLCTDSASAARFVAEQNDPRIASISSAEAASTYKLSILKENVQSFTRNITRFGIISRESLRDGEGTKGSILFTIPHESGSLVRFLDKLAQIGLNLTRIESRPLHDRPFEYRFFIDFEIEEKVRKSLDSALDALRKYALELRVLGAYSSLDADTK